MESLDMMSDSNSVNLTDIPYELIVKILSTCDIIDVLHLRCCCRSFCLASNDRSIWVTLFVTLTTQTSLPIYRSSLTNELEKLTTSHIRFGKLIQPHTYLEPCLPIASQRSLPLGGVCARAAVCLLMGGLYLLVAGVRLELWYLGVENHTIPRLVVFCAFDVQLDGEEDLAFENLIPTENGGQFCFSISGINDNNYVYHLVLNDGQPRFDLIGYYPQISNESAYNGRGLVAFPEFHGSEMASIIVYDIQTRRRMSIPMPLPVNEDTEITFLNQDTVAIWTNTECLQILPLPDRSSLFDGRRILLDWPFPWIIHKTYHSPSYRWTILDRALSQLPGSLTFHTISQNEPSPPFRRFGLRTTTIIRTKYQQPSSNSSYSPHIPDHFEWNKECTIFKEYYLDPIHKILFPGSLNCPNNHHFMWWQDQEVWTSIQVLKCADNASPCNLFEWDYGGYKDGDGLAWPSYSFSPILGRLAVTDPLNGCIRIYEYLE